MVEILEKYVGRLAPSPTGALHLGNVRTFMIAYLRARSLSGRIILRMEDLDHPRDKPGADLQAIEDLRWLGFEWDEEYVQSKRKALYKDALGKLLSHTPYPLAYPCICSRKDVEAAQSAPHQGEQHYYPGICRDRFSSWAQASNVKINPCWRFRVDNDDIISFKDNFAGIFEMDVAKTLGDFPLARDEFGAGYTLAVVVDDAAMGVTEVVRADDLLAATPPQILIQRALNLPTPQYCHVPLVVGEDGKRLAKRHGDTRICALRAQGLRKKEIIGTLAASCGWIEKGEDATLEELIPLFDLSTIPHEPFIWRM